MATWITDIDGDLINTDAIAHISVHEFWERVEGPDGEKTRQVTGYRVVAVMRRPTADAGKYGVSSEVVGLTKPRASRLHVEKQRGLVGEMLVTYGGDKIIPLVGDFP